MTMKLFVIVLALGIFTGSQLFVLSDRPDFKQALLRNFTSDLEVKMNIVQSSEFGAGLLGLLHGAYVQTSRRLRKLEGELPTEVTEGLDAVVGVSTGVAEKGIRILYEAWKKKDTEKGLERALADLYANGTLGSDGSHANPSLHVVISRSREANEKLNEMLKYHLDKLRPRAQEVQSQVYQFQESVVQPVANQTVEALKLVVEKVNQVAKPYFARFLKALRDHRAEFREWVSSPVFPPEQ